MEQAKSDSKKLAALKKRVEQWRAACAGRRMRVPEDIWSAAVATARVVGVNATSKATRLGYYSIAARLDAAAAAAQTWPQLVEEVAAPQAPSMSGAPLSRETSPVAFVEIAAPVARPSREPLTGKMVVELEGGGKRLRIETTCALDVVGLAQAFWRDDRCSN
jgi:hypothetical protein